MSKTITLTREKLYEKIWKDAPTRVADKLNISYAKLKKLCEEKNIPLPPPDYYLKQRQGIMLPVTPLPPGDNERLEFTLISHRKKKPSSDFKSRHIPLCIFRILENQTDENTCITMSEIISIMKERYNLPVTRATVYKAISALQDLNFDITGYEANGGLGYNYERPLKPSQIKLIHESLALNPLLSEEKEHIIRRELNNIMSFHNGVYNRRQVVSDHVKNSRYNPWFYMAIEAIDMAMIQNTKIEFDYVKPNINGELIPMENGHFKLLPCKILISDNRYFLRCIDPGKHGSILFRIEQMRNVTVTEEVYQNIPASISHQIYADGFLNAYNEYTTVTFKCDNSLVDSVSDFFSRRFVTPQFTPFDDNTFTVTGRIPYHKALEWALTNIDKAVALEPQCLVDEVRKKLKNNLYNV